MIILKNYKKIPQEEAQIPLLSEEFQYGTALFETMLYKNNQIQNLQFHIERLTQSQKKLGHDLLDSEKLKEEVKKLKLDSSSKIKIISLKNEIYTIISKLDLRLPKEIKLKSIQSSSVPLELKSTSYIQNILAYKQATDCDFFDALLIDKQNNILECSRSNIFWVENDQLYTNNQNILPGTKRREIIQNHNVLFKNISLTEIKKFPCYITNAIIGIVSVDQIDQTKLPKSNYFSSS